MTDELIETWAEIAGIFGKDPAWFRKMYRQELLDARVLIYVRRRKKLCACCFLSRLQLWAGCKAAKGEIIGAEYGWKEKKTDF
jgi:hypothetical protein